MKLNITSKHTTQFKNWVKELLTEEKGQEIARKGLSNLEFLYERCTSKKPIKKTK